jgi:outer membrane protein assembly factor BamB
MPALRRQAVHWPAAVLGVLLCCDPALPREGHEEAPTAAAPGPSRSPADGERRRAELLVRAARARESEGKVREALDAYLALAALDAGEVLLPLPGEPAVKASPAVLARAGVAGMLGKADGKTKKAVAREVRRRWEALKGRDDLEALRTFVAVFGPETAEGRAARLRLADLLARKASFRAAELLLEEVRRHPGDARAAGRAVLGLAKSCARERLPADAVYYYDVLARDFGKVALAGTKTGSDLRDDLATDKRFLPYLDPGPGFPSGKFRVVARDDSGGSREAAEVFFFTHLGEPLPFFRRYGLALDFPHHAIRLLDRATGEERGHQEVPRTHFRKVVRDRGAAGAARFSYQTLGHLAVLPVADRVFGLDPVRGTVLWERDLSKGMKPTAEPEAVAVGPRGGGVRVSYPGGWTQRLGVPLPLAPDGVCVAGRDGLLCLDPLTGRTRWLRPDVRPDAHVFGDRQIIFVVETAARGSASATRAFRMADGGAVKVPDFRRQYDRRLRLFGTRIVLSEKDARGEVVLSLYDPRTGKTAWRQNYPARSVVLNAVDNDLAGVIAPDGRVRVADLRTGKEVLDAKVDPKHLKGARAVHLLADPALLYLAVNGPPDEKVIGEGGVQSPFASGTGLRSVPVNGQVYAFDRATGGLRWHRATPSQTLLLNSFGESPVLLFAARYKKWGHAPPTEVDAPVRRVPVDEAVALAVQKSTGKVVYDRRVPHNTAYYALYLNPAERRVDLVGDGAVRLAIEPRR